LFVSEEDGFRIGLPKQGSYWGAETQADRNKHNYAREGDQLMLKNVDMYHFAKWPKESNAQMKCDMRIMHAIVKGDLSFNVVEQEWFQELMIGTDPRLHVKGRWTFTNIKLPMLVRDLKFEVDNVLADELPTCSAVCLTADFWKAKSSDNFVNVELHFIDRNFNFRHYTLAFKHWTDREYGIDICNGLSQIIANISAGNIRNAPPKPRKLTPLEQAAKDAEEATAAAAAAQQGTSSQSMIQSSQPTFAKPQLLKKGKGKGKATPQPEPSPRKTPEEPKRPPKFFFPLKHQKIIIITDSDRKMMHGVKLAKEKGVLTDGFKCADHQLQLSLKKAFDQALAPYNVTHAIDKARDFASKINQSGGSNNILEEQAERMAGKIII